MFIPGAPRDTSRATMDFDGGGSTQTVQGSSAPWEGQQSYLKTGFGKAQTLLDAGPYQFYPNSTVVPFSNQTQDALTGIEARARAGSPVQAAGSAEALKTIRGDYLDAGNPAFSAMMKRVSSEVTPQIGATFAGAGRYGSGAHAGALSSALTDTAGQLAFQNYGDERNRMGQMTAAAPQIAQGDYLDLAQLFGAGQQREAKAGEELSDQVQRFNFEQQAPDEALRRYMSLVAGGSYGGQNVQTTSANRGTSMNDIAGGLFSLAGTGLALNKMGLF